VERTFVMIKPDAVQRGIAGEIIARIERKGLKIVGMKMLHIDRELAEKHYAEHSEKPFFRDLVDYVTSSPVIAIVFEGKNAVSIVRTLVGATNPAEALPGTIRGDYGLETGRNVIHASDSDQSANREIALFFDSNELFDYKRIDEDWLYE